MAARGTGPNDSSQEPQEKRKKGREEEEEEEERMVEERGERVKEEGRRWQRGAKVLDLWAASCQAGCWGAGR